MPGFGSDAILVQVPPGNVDVNRTRGLGPPAGIRVGRIRGINYQCDVRFLLIYSLSEYISRFVIRQAR